MPAQAKPSAIELSRGDRVFRILLMAGTAGLSWLGFMALHELGHCLSAWVSGGEVERVVLSPVALSRTDLAHNPHPLFVAWGGALWGVAIPLALWGAAVAARRGGEHLFRFFAGFCLVANGVYIGLDAFVLSGDGRDMVLHGCPTVWPVLFGAAATASGFLLWHGTGARFGLGPNAERPSRAEAVAVAGALLALVLAELLVFGL